jgi:hypothetical protein
LRRHAVGGAKELARMGHELAVGGMIEGLDRRDTRHQLRRMALNMLEQLMLGVRRTADEDRTSATDGFHHRVKERLVLGAVATADPIRLVMDMPCRPDRVYHGALDVIGIEMKHAGLVVIDPDDRVKMLTQEVLL